MGITEVLPEITQFGVAGLIVVCLAWVLNSTGRYAMDKLASVGKDLATAINALENASQKAIGSHEATSTSIVKTLDLMRDEITANRTISANLVVAVGDVTRATETELSEAKTSREKMHGEVAVIHTKLDTLVVTTGKMVEMLESHEKTSERRAETLQGNLKGLGETIVRNMSELGQAIKALDTKLGSPAQSEAGEAQNDPTIDMAKVIQDNV